MAEKKAKINAVVTPKVDSKAAGAVNDELSALVKDKAVKIKTQLDTKQFNQINAYLEDLKKQLFSVSKLMQDALTINVRDDKGSVHKATANIGKMLDKVSENTTSLKANFLSLIKLLEETQAEAKELSQIKNTESSNSLKQISDLLSKLTDQLSTIAEQTSNIFSTMSSKDQIKSVAAYEKELAKAQQQLEALETTQNKFLSNTIVKNGKNLQKYFGYLDDVNDKTVFGRGIDKVAEAYDSIRDGSKSPLDYNALIKQIRAIADAGADLSQIKFSAVINGETVEKTALNFVKLLNASIKKYGLDIEPIKFNAADIESTKSKVLELTDLLDTARKTAEKPIKTQIDTESISALGEVLSQIKAVIPSEGITLNGSIGFSDEQLQNFVDGLTDIKNVLIEINDLLKNGAINVNSSISSNNPFLEMQQKSEQYREQIRLLKGETNELLDSVYTQKAPNKQARNLVLDIQSISEQLLRSKIPLKEQIALLEELRKKEYEYADLVGLDTTSIREKWESRANSMENAAQKASEAVAQANPDLNVEASATNVSTENAVVENASIAFKDAAQMKEAFAEANKKVAASAETSADKVDQEAKATKDVSKNMQKAAEAGKDFLTLKANKSSFGSSIGSMIAEMNKALNDYSDSGNFKKVEKVKELIAKLQSGNFKLDFNDSRAVADQLATITSRVNIAIKDLANSATKGSQTFGKLTSANQKYFDTFDTSNKIPEFSNALANAQVEIASLNNKLESGAIDVKEYNNEVKKLKDSLNNKGWDINGPWGTYSGSFSSFEDAYDRVKKEYDTSKAVSGIDIINNTKKGLTEFTYKIKEADGEVKTLKYTYSSAFGAMYESTTKVSGALSGTFNNLRANISHLVKEFNVVFSGSDLIHGIVRQFGNGVTVLKQFDAALTDISYSMELTEDGLNDMGNAATKMANDLDMSLENIGQIYQIYANMETTAEEITEIATPTAILSNLSGVDAATASDQVQGIIQQFHMLEDAASDVADVSMHVVDALDMVAANVSLDYAKGIGIVTEAITATGQVAHDAGMSYEELAAASAKIAERTREDGSTIGNAIKTMLTRISKVASMPSYADEIDNESVSKAAEALHEIGIEVYRADGSFNDVTDTITQLNDKWDSLTDAQRSYISFQVAATRQSSKFKSMLEGWTEAMTIAERATNANGNALANQEKYQNSYNARIQSIATGLETYWLKFFDNSSTKKALDFLQKLIDGFNDLADTITPLGALITGALGALTGFSHFKSILHGGGKPKMSGFLNMPPCFLTVR